MTMKGVMRLGTMQIKVMDLDQAIQHYVNIVGLDLVERVGKTAYLKAYDEFDKWSVALHESDSPGMVDMGWKVREDADLDRFAARVADMGIDVTEHAAGSKNGVGRRIAFTLPTGHPMELYAEMEMGEDHPAVHNPDLWRKPPHGARSQKLDHCLLYGDDLDGTFRVFKDALDMDLAETGFDGDTRIFAFFTCSNRAHDIAFVRFPEPGRLHHAAFRLDSWGDVGHAADLFTQQNVSVDIGPTRHGITRGQTIYFFDPSGNRNETFCGGYEYYPDMPTRTWDPETFGKAIFYYERALNDRFMGVVT